MDGDLTARMVSMGNVHRALPLTGVLGFAVAAAIEGTVVARALRAAAGAPKARGVNDGEDPGPRVRLISPSGVISAAAAVRRTEDGSGWRAEHASVRRTQRRLFDGFVYVPAGRVPGLASLPTRKAAGSRPAPSRPEPR